MKIPTKRLMITLILLTIGILPTMAQEGLQINSIFEKYGRQRGSTMVVLSGKSLERYKLDKYQSITLRYDQRVSADIQKALDVDKKHAEKIKEVVTNGRVTLGYYKLNQSIAGINRYILFKVGSDGMATLIYMEGGEGSEEMVNQLFLRE